MSGARWVRPAAVAVAASALGLCLVPSAARASGGAPPASPAVRIPFPQDDGSLTPYTFELGHALVMLIYDSLMQRDASGVPQPWLARSVEASAGGRQLTIRLREGVRWHDGTPLAAEDVAFTFDFVATHPHPRFTPELQAVERVTVTDPSTVVVGLRHPAPGFLDQPLADLPILPAHLWKGLPPGRLAPEGLAVGTGPYRLVEHRPNAGYRLESNADYFRGPPAVRAIDVPVIRSADEMVSALERRRVDMIPLNLTRDAAERVERVGTRVARGPSYLGTVLLFNLRLPPFDQLPLRQALSKALDLARIARSAGNAVPAERGYLHPESRWASTVDLHVFDEKAAREALAGLHPPPVEVLAPENDPVKLEAGRQVVLALQRLGLVATLREASPAELSRALGEDGSPASFQAAIGSAPPLSSYDPDFLGRTFTSDPSRAPYNRTGYRSLAFDELSWRVATLADPRARQAAVDDALRLLSVDLPVVPLFFAEGTYAYRPAVYDGWVFVKGAGILDKRSFVEPRGTLSSPASPSGDSGPIESWLSRFWMRLMALALLAVAVVIAVRRLTWARG